MTEPRKFCHVKWIDSIGTAGWQPKTHQKCTEKQMTIESIGILFAEDDFSITITSSLSAYGGPESPLQIPKIAIIEYAEYEL